MKEKKEKALLHISEITSPSFVPPPSPGSGDSPHPFIKCRTFSPSFFSPLIPPLALGMWSRSFFGGGGGGGDRRRHKGP